MVAKSENMQRDECPSREVLRVFLAGSAEESQLQTIAAHISRCETCLSELDAMQGADEADIGGRNGPDPIAPDEDQQELVKVEEKAQLIASEEASLTASFQVSASTEREDHAAGLHDGTEQEMPEFIGRGRRYHVRRKLGQGTFAAVYLAHDTHLDRLVAIKLSHDAVIRKGERERFLNEARTVRKLQHANIVEVYDVDFTDDDRALIAMEFVDGQSLRGYLKEHGPLNPVEAARIMIPIAKAMAHMHESDRRLVHRDLKPDNILLARTDGGPIPKIADFGLAIRDDACHPRGQYAGTTAYMSPEQIECRSDNLDGRTDVWALGVILYEMLTGSRPFLGRGSTLRRRILEDSPKLPREHRPEIPAALEDFCRRCLIKDREARTTTAADLAEGLGEFVALQAASPAQPETIIAGRQGAGPPGHRSPLQPSARLLVAVGLIAVVAIGAAAAIYTRIPAPTVDEVAAPGEWTSILRRGPTIISKNYKPIMVNQPKRGGPITVIADARVIAQLDETSAADFDLKLVFQKTNWTGEFGVFWGHRPTVHGKRRCRVCNAVVFNCSQDTNGEKFVEVSHHRWLFIPNAEGDYETQDLIGAQVPLREKHHLRTANLGQIDLMVRGTEVRVQWQRRTITWPVPPAFGNAPGGMGFINANGESLLGRAEFLKPLQE